MSQKSAVSIHRPYGNGAVKHHRLDLGKWEERREDRGEEEREEGKREEAW